MLKVELGKPTHESVTHMLFHLVDSIVVAGHFVLVIRGHSVR